MASKREIAENDLFQAFLSNSLSVLIRQKPPFCNENGGFSNFSGNNAEATQSGGGLPQLGFDVAHA